MTPLQLTCRFCYRPLIYAQTSASPGSTLLYQYKCLACNSTQHFWENGSPAHYTFTIGNYILIFLPAIQAMEIVRINHNPNGTTLGNLVLKLPFLPTNLTPQNTTEDRIKTMIVFS